jgi:hypothetical protein
VAATDNNVQGEVFADRLRQMADSAGCDFSRLRPEAEDWNEELKNRGGRKESCRIRGQRIKGEAAARNLTAAQVVLKGRGISRLLVYIPFYRNSGAQYRSRKINI